MSIEDVGLDSMEALLAQSMRGIHLLYENDTIAKILKKPTEEMNFFTLKNLQYIQDLFSRFIEIGGFEEKRLFLKNLDPESFEILLRTYFYILDNSIRTGDFFKH